MSANFTQTRGHDMKNSDTRSEISESGTGTSGWASCWDSREDLTDFVTKLGIKDATDIYQDRFRVDRKKLEQMLSGDCEAPLSAEIFFEQIMSDTGTFISWPSKLKIGAKCKKDPHVRIAGRPDDVQAAKERVLNALLTRTNRVTMKIDVSYTDHSHIIGRGGLSIKRIMEETHCHVHFPDSNRCNALEKSNQVSIAGDIRGVEKARSRVRQKTPVIFGFELPIMSNNVDPKCDYIINIQEQYNVQVIFRTRPKLHATLVQVKGVQWDVEKVKKATLLLIDFMCGNLATQTSIQISMEISPHHQQMVMGKNHSNLKEVIKATGVQIMFPDAQDPNIPALKKSNVTITGNVHNVYAARQMLIGSLPLILMFDMPGLPLTSDRMMDIENKYEVTINIRQKTKQNTSFCIIKGHERSVSNIYKARNEILARDEDGDDHLIIADIPKNYHISQFKHHETLPKLVTETRHLNPQPLSPKLSPLLTPTWQYPPPTYYRSQFPLYQQSFNLNNFNQPQQSMTSSGYHSMGQFSKSNLTSEQNSFMPSSSSCNNVTNNLPSSNSGNHSPIHKQKNCTVTNNLDSSFLSDINPNGPYLTTMVDKEQTKRSNYEHKRMAGYKVMYQKPVDLGEYRYPTGHWAGYGISHTTPVNLNKTFVASDYVNESSKSPGQDYFDTSSSLSSTQLNTSNLMDNLTPTFVNHVSSSKWNDVTSLLISLGLEKYICLFTSHEIDLSTLASMTEKDLMVIGITAFGARSKLLLAISELRQRSNSFSLAPGAERKSKCTTLNTSLPNNKW